MGRHWLVGREFLRASSPDPGRQNIVQLISQRSGDAGFTLAGKSDSLC